MTIKVTGVNIRGFGESGLPEITNAKDAYNAIRAGGAEKIIGGFEFIQLTKSPIPLEETIHCFNNPDREVVLAALWALPQKPDALTKSRLREPLETLALREPNAFEGLCIQSEALYRLRAFYGDDVARGCAVRMKDNYGEQIMTVVRHVFCAAIN